MKLKCRKAKWTIPSPGKYSVSRISYSSTSFLVSATLNEIVPHLFPFHLVQNVYTEAYLNEPAQGTALFCQWIASASFTVLTVHLFPRCNYANDSCSFKTPNNQVWRLTCEPFSAFTFYILVIKILHCEYHATLLDFRGSSVLFFIFTSVQNIKSEDGKGKGSKTHDAFWKHNKWLFFTLKSTLWEGESGLKKVNFVAFSKWKRMTE